MHERYLRDEATMKYWAEKEGLEKGMKKGIKEGVKQGIKQGIKQGEKESRKKVAINMLKQNMEDDLICDLTELSKEEIEELKESINKG